jgi:preprotein translocase subunit SecG
MNAFTNIVMAVQLLSALAMIGLILMQHGKGADAGAAFGGGSSGSLFGASGSANFLSRSTAVLATVFFVSTLFLSYVGYRPTAGTTGASILESVAPGASIPVEAAPPAAAPELPAKGAGAIPQN